MPTAFTPNGDGLNDLCRPVIFGTLDKYEFTVYNRYGETVFHSKQPGKGWDGMVKGKQQNAGTFMWVCQYQLDGKMLELEKGTVVLIR